MSAGVEIGPLFAREASHLLTEGNIQRAMELCLAGTVAFPNYATGHLVLGRCYEAINRFSEATAEYKKVLAALPDNAAVRGFLTAVEAKERQQFEQYARQQEKKLEGKGSIPLEDFLTETPERENEGSAIEYLAKRLQDVKRIQPKPGVENQEPMPFESRSIKFVTSTMAEIYVGQGEYAEAIEAYRELVRQHPEEAEKYRRRIAEIEELLAMQHRDKTLRPPTS